MANNKKTSGCGTWLELFLGASVLAFGMEYWKVIVTIILVIVIMFVINYAVKKNREEESKKLVEIKKNTVTGRKLTGGCYVSGRDISAGIYDVRVLDGNGSLNLPVNGILFLNEGESFRNIELPPNSQMSVSVGMSIDLYNQRNFSENIHSPSDNQEPPYSQMHDDINHMDGHAFDFFCAEVLKKNNYQDVKVTRGSGDHGVDIVAVRDGIKYAVQCKRYNNGVGNKAIQEIYSGKAYYHCHVGIVMTNSYFTPSAKEEAERNGIILWDGEFLKTYMDDFSFPESLANSSFEQTVPDEKNVESPEQSANESEDDVKMYDVEKGIYPPGHYVVGKTLPKGAYLLKARGDARGQVSFYATSENLLNDNDIISYQSFDDDFFLTLFENNMCILVENADIQKVNEVS